MISSLSGNSSKREEYKSLRVYFYGSRRCCRPYKVNHSVGRQGNVLALGVCCRFRSKENNPVYCALHRSKPSDWDLQAISNRVVGGGGVVSTRCSWCSFNAPLNLPLCYVMQRHQFHQILTIYCSWLRKSEEFVTKSHYRLYLFCQCKELRAGSLKARMFIQNEVLTV
jgi:hypothetical protein